MGKKLGKCLGERWSFESFGDPIVHLFRKVLERRDVYNFWDINRKINGV